MKSVFRIASIIICSAAVFAALTLSCNVNIMVKVLIASGFALLCLMLWGIEAKNPVQRRAGGGKSDFDWGMHYFRAFAIVAIMATHYCTLFGHGEFSNIFLGSSTIYFLFISGYLCQYIDFKRRDVPLVYYRKKLTNVICPFLIFSVLFMVLRNAFHFDLATLRNVVLGRAQSPYWYIPFVSILFLISPILCRLQDRVLALVSAVALFLFLVFPFRPGIAFCLEWPYAFYLYAYFSFFYVVGFVYCRFKEQADKIFVTNQYWFLVGAVFLVFMLWRPGSVELQCFSYGFTVGMQRFMTLICVLVVLGSLKNKRIWLLDQLATYSFTLYFIHWGVFSRTVRVHDAIVATLPMPAALSDCLVFCIYVVGLLLCAMIFKVALGKWSRAFLGS